MKNFLKNNLDVFFTLFVFILFYWKKEELIFNYNNYDLIAKQIIFIISSCVFYISFSFMFIMHSLKKFVLSLNVLLLTLFVILINAPTINSFLQSTEKQIFLLTFLIPFFILFIVNKLIRSILSLFKKISNIKYYMFSKKSRYNTLVHEIGHATLLAYIEKDLIINTDIKINKYKIPFITSYNGRLYIEAKKFEIYDNKKFFEWTMLKALAGSVSEKCIVDKNPMYNSTDENSDYTIWTNLAKQYLSSGFDSLYYSNPKNEEEITTNIISMNNLKNKQEKILEEFLLLNKNIINNFIENYIDKKIEKKEIFELCEKITKIDQIPEIKATNFIN